MGRLNELLFVLACLGFGWGIATGQDWIAHHQIGLVVTDLGSPSPAPDIVAGSESGVIEEGPAPYRSTQPERAFVYDSWAKKWEEILISSSINGPIIERMSLGALATLLDSARHDAEQKKKQKVERPKRKSPKSMKDLIGRL